MRPDGRHDIMAQLARWWTNGYLCKLRLRKCFRSNFFTARRIACKRDVTKRYMAIKVKFESLYLDILPFGLIVVVCWMRLAALTVSEVL